MKTVLYITYIDMQEMTSGSMVRPQKIYSAFIEEGFNIKLLKGSELRNKKEKRIKSIYEIEEWLKDNTPDYCYIESPSSPIIFKEDLNLIKKIHKKNIKIGFFYRDAYYKLGKKYVFQNTKFSVKKYLKYYFYKLLAYRTDNCIRKNVDIVYFPSESMSKFFDFKDKRALPPAAEKVEYTYSESNNLIYVGGVSEEYGTNLIFEAMDIVNKKHEINLNLVCRKEEMNNIPKQYLNKKWLKIYHASDKELKPIYENSKLALIAKKPSVYNNFAISVKIFEYITYGLPIIAVNTYETNKIIEKYKIGISTDVSSESLANGILTLYENNKLYNELKENIKLSLNENLWSTRVKQIDYDLSNIES